MDAVYVVQGTTDGRFLGKDDQFVMLMKDAQMFDEPDDAFQQGMLHFGERAFYMYLLLCPKLKG